MVEQKEDLQAEAAITVEVQEAAVTVEAQEVATPEDLETKKTKSLSHKISAEPDEDFDWDEFSKNDTANFAQSGELAEKYEDTLSKVNEGEVVEGVVIAMNKREVVINIGYKSDGVVSTSEFRYNQDLKIGDKVEVFVESQEDKKGQ